VSTIAHAAYLEEGKQARGLYHVVSRSFDNRCHTLTAAEHQLDMLHQQPSYYNCFVIAAVVLHERQQQPSFYNCCVATTTALWSQQQPRYCNCHVT